MYWSSASVFLPCPAPHCYSAVTCRASTDISFLAFSSFFLKDYAIMLQVASNGGGIARDGWFPKYICYSSFKMLAKGKENLNRSNTWKISLKCALKTGYSTMKTTEAGLFPYRCSAAAISVSSCRCWHDLRSRRGWRRKPTTLDYVL